LLPAAHVGKDGHRKNDAFKGLASVSPKFLDDREGKSHNELVSADHHFDWIVIRDTCAIRSRGSSFPTTGECTRSLMPN